MFLEIFNCNQISWHDVSPWILPNLCVRTSRCFSCFEGENSISDFRLQSGIPLDWMSDVWPVFVVDDDTSALTYEKITKLFASKKNRISIAAMFMKLQFTLYQFSDSICLWYFEQFVSFNSLNISSESNSLTVSKGFQKQLAIPKLTDPNATYSSFFLLRLWTWTNFFPVSSGYFIWRSLRQPNQNRNLNRQLLTIKSRWWAVVNLKSGK